MANKKEANEPLFYFLLFIGFKQDAYRVFGRKIPSHTTTLSLYLFLPH